MIFRAALYVFIRALISQVLIASVVVGVLALDVACRVNSAAFLNMAWYALVISTIVAIGAGTVLLWRRWEPRG